MAYAFSDLTRLLNNGEDGQSQANIFGAGGPSAQSQGQNAAPKTDASGDLGATGGGASPNESPAQIAGTPADMSGYAANAGKVSAPSSISNTVGQIKKASDDLQSEANAYVTSGTKAQNYDIGDYYYNKAVAGDPSARGRITTTLGRTDINPVDDFYAKTDTSINDADAALSGTAGVDYMLKKSNGPTYTSGMASFDNAMLQENAGFRNLLAKISGDYNALKTKADTIGDTSKAKIEEVGKANLLGAQGRIKGRLTADQKALLAAEDAAVVAANAQRAGAVSTPQAKALADKELKEETEKVRQALEASRPGAGDVVRSMKPVDIMQFFKLHPEYKRQDLITAEQAKKFNSLSGLLGISDFQDAGKGIGDLYTYDDKSLYNALAGSGGNALSSRDKADKHAMDVLFEEAKKSARYYNDQEKNFKLQDLADTINGTRRSWLDQNFDGYHFMANLKDGRSTDAMDYLKAIDNPDVSYTDVMTKEQAAKLNSLAKRLGLPQTYKAGGFNPNRELSSFDKKAFYDAVLQAARESKEFMENQKRWEEEARNPPPPPPPPPEERPDNISDFMPGSHRQKREMGRASHEFQEEPLGDFGAGVKEAGKQTAGTIKTMAAENDPHLERIFDPSSWGT